MSKQRTITTEAQLREAVRTLGGGLRLDWRWKDWEPRRDRE